VRELTPCDSVHDARIAHGALVQQGNGWNDIVLEFKAYMFKLVISTTKDIITDSTLEEPAGLVRPSEHAPIKDI